MPQVLVDKENLETLTEFLDLYKGELERESAERAKQAVVDSKQAEVLAKEKIEAEKQAENMAKVEADKLKADEAKELAKEKEQRGYQFQLQKSVDEISEKVSSEDVLNQLNQLNTKVDRVFTIAESGKPYIKRADYVVTVIGFSLLVVLPLYFIIRWLYWQLNIFK